MRVLIKEEISAITGGNSGAFFRYMLGGGIVGTVATTVVLGSKPAFYPSNFTQTFSLFAMSVLVGGIPATVLALCTAAYLRFIP